ncbi:Putative RxLR effector [Phytophthora palmivora]|uniref:RxLR effector protein n=1 Tax=Phytophthora palmivora TaxID=4796 RepID=A0A2P4WWC3_9STRA|nr:Putative RxLR effector [Phytophthora palmivora]
MRPLSVLYVAMAIGFLVTCDATSNSDQSKTILLESSHHGRSLGTKHEYDASGRFLRVHHENEVERVFDAIKNAVNKAEVKSAAKKILADDSKADAVYKTWAEKYSKLQIGTLLNVGKKKKYESVYNGYVTYVNTLS